MTSEDKIRDDFAKAALPAIILASAHGQHSPGEISGLEDAPEEARIAADAYAIADAMMEARK